MTPTINQCPRLEGDRGTRRHETGERQSTQLREGMGATQGRGPLRAWEAVLLGGVGGGSLARGGCRLAMAGAVGKESPSGTIQASWRVT
jgi:hypothetical protein